MWERKKDTKRSLLERSVVRLRMSRMLVLGLKLLLLLLECCKVLTIANRGAHVTSQSTTPRTQISAIALLEVRINPAILFYGSHGACRDRRRHFCAQDIAPDVLVLDVGAPRAKCLLH